MFGAIIDASKQDIGDKNFMISNFEVVIDGSHHFFDGVATGNGHQFFPFVVEGVVERKGEVDVWLFSSQAFYAGNDAYRAHGEATGTEADEVFGGENFDGGKSMIRVGEGFAHAHKDDGVDGEVVFLKVEDLVDDFFGGEVFFEADTTGSAKQAAKGTAGLGGDAKGGVGLVLQADGFDLVAVAGGKENLVGGGTTAFANFGER